MSRDDATLLDILQAAEMVVQFTAGADQEVFLNDPKTQAAVLHKLLLMGEAVKRLSMDFRSRYPGVPWKAIAGMRDKLIHSYDAVDVRETWKVAISEVPQLIPVLRGLLEPGA